MRTSQVLLNVFCAILVIALFVTYSSHLSSPSQIKKQLLGEAPLSPRTFSVEVPMAAVNTNTYKASVPITGTLKLTNQRDSGNGQDPGPTWAVAVGAGNVLCYVSRLWWNYSSGEWSYYIPFTNFLFYQGFIPAQNGPDLQEGDIAFVYNIFDTELNSAPGPYPAQQLIVLTSGQSSISLDFEMKFGNLRLTRERTSTAATGRDSAPVYSAETSVKDAWVETGHPWSYYVKFGDITWSGTQTWVEEEYYTGWSPFLSAPGGVQFFYGQKDGITGHEYADLSAAIDGSDLNFTGREKVYGDFHLDGDGSSLKLHCNTTGSVANQAIWNAIYYWPFILNFAPVDADNRVGTKAGSLQISGGFKATSKIPATLSMSKNPGPPYSAPSSGDTVYPTLSQLCGIGVYVSSDNIVGLDYKSGYDSTEFVAGPSVHLTITPESARACKHTDEDLSFELQVPPVNHSNCTRPFTWNGLSLTHRNNVGIYGPHPAHTHEDWIPGGGASAVGTDGLFNVSGALGALTLDLASGYETRLGQITAQDFPAGVPGAPQMYWYHEADLWHAYDGEPGVTTGNPWSCPPEAVYCWRGWSWLQMHLNGEASSELVVTLKGKTFTVSDPHCNGSARQTDFTYTDSAFTHQYTQGLAAGDHYLSLCLVNPTVKGRVDLEVVEQIRLEGLAQGSWSLYEPKLVLDNTQSQHATVKVFEAPSQGGDSEHSGGGYREGGFSAHVDAAYWKCLYLGTQHNPNVEEPTIGMFDPLLSANYELDLTVAFALTAVPDLLTKCSDAWSCALNGSTYTAALCDGTNELSAWAFDIPPLEHEVDSGSLACAIRAGGWEVARGISCDIVTDKVIGGLMHGIAYNGNDLVRSGAYADVYKRYPESGTWEMVSEDLAALPAGHWETGNLEEVYGYTSPSLYYQHYGASRANSGDPTTDVDRAPVRETVAWWEGTVAGGRWVALENLHGTARNRAWGGVDGALTVELAGRSQVLSGSLYYSSPNLLRLDARGEAVLVCGYGDDTEVRTNEGGQWSVPTTIREDRSHPCACVLLPTSDLYVIGLTDGLAYGQRVFYKGSGSYEIGTEDLVYSDVLESDCEVRQTPLGVLEFLFHDGNGQLCMVSSEDCGETWS